MTLHSIAEAHRRKELRAELGGCIVPVNGYYVSDGRLGIELTLGDLTLFVDLQQGDRLLCREGEDA
jgi:hypothetical protein